MISLRRRESPGTRFRCPPPGPVGWLVLILGAVCWGDSAAGRQPLSPENDILAQQRRERWNEIAPRSRRLRSAYLRARTALVEGRHADALQLIHGLLNAAEDTFFWPEGAERPVSLHRATEELLEKAPHDVYRLYLLRHGAVARSLLRRAGDDALLWHRLLRTYFLTPAGREAARRLAVRALDRGDRATARRLLQRILDSPIHQRTMSESERAALRVLHEMVDAAAEPTESGPGPTSRRPAVASNDRHGVASALVEDFPSSQPTVADSPWRSTSAPQDVRLREYRLLGGSARRNGRFAASPPFPVPLWVRSLTGTEGMNTLIAEWQQLAAGEPLSLPGSAIVPVTVGRQLVVRDAHGIIALDIPTGRPLWRYRTLLTWRQTFEAFNTLQSNPLVALRNGVLANPTLGTLATDGRYVYAVELTGTQDTGEILQGRIITSSGERREVPIFEYSNRLVALSLTLPGADAPQASSLCGVAERLRDANELSVSVSAADAPVLKEPVWTTDELPKPETAEVGGGKYFFVGPPLPAGELVYIQAERGGLIYVLALRAKDGRLVWAQPVALSGSPIARNPVTVRHTIAATPTLAGGLLLCPSGFGSLTAVDPLTGVLQWIYDLRDTSHAGTQRQSRSVVPSPGASPLPVVVRADGDRLVFFERGSRLIHCVAIADGTAEWIIPRGATLDIACLDRRRDLCVLVDPLNTRCVSLQDGRPRWSIQLGIPSGMSVFTGDRLVVPLKDGHVAVLDPTTGERRSLFPWSFTPPDGYTDEDVPPAAWPHYRNLRLQGWLKDRLTLPGHLVPAGAYVVSVRPGTVAVYPQAGPLRQAVAALEQTESSDLPPDIDAPVDASVRNRVLLMAELDEILGDVADSERRLDDWLERLGMPRLDPYAAALKRELLYAKLRKAESDRAAILDEIRELAFSKAERGRYLVERTEWLLRRGDVRGVVAGATEFQRLGLRRPVTAFGNPHHFLAPKAWITSVLSRLYRRASAAGRDELQRLVTERLLALTDERRIEPLEDFVTQFAEWPEAAAVRIRLADLYLERSELQKAELHLLAAAARGDAPTALLARVRLAEVLDRAGLCEEAADRLDRLRHEVPGGVLPDGRTVADAVASLPLRPATRRMLAGTTGVAWPVETALIRQIPWQRHDVRFATVYGRYRKTYAVPHDWQLLAFDRGTDEEGKLVFVDRLSGYQAGSVRVPRRFMYPSWRRYPGGSHLIPLGAAGTMFAVSALEYGRPLPVWETPFPRSGGVDSVLVGPAGATFCIFQYRQHLVAVDPLDGRVLWYRRDVPPVSGLHIDGYAGLIGDDRAIVLFEADRRSYIVYRTLDGRILRRGELDIDARYARRAFGRKLFYVTDSPVDRRMRIWDPLTDTVEFDAPFNGRMLTYLTPQHELAIVLPNGQLHVIDVPNNRTRLKLPLSPARLRALTYVRVFSDRDHYFVNLQHSGPVQRSRLFSSYATDLSLSVVPVHGALLCIDARSGRKLWERELPQRSVLDLSSYRLPFLVTLSSIRDTYRAYQRSLLVELIDLRSGNTILRQENLPPDRIAHVTVDPAGVLRIDGFNGALEIDFSRRVQNLLREPIVFRDRLAR
ncbi:MAG: hypothetical protein D6725_03350 [Planctomycetota bacterium]|nr:MAG: hypothetical protein D6725_03350 [Planctomycetota bacterium]